LTLYVTVGTGNSV